MPQLIAVGLLAWAVPATLPSTPIKLIVYVSVVIGVTRTPKAPVTGTGEPIGDPLGVGDPCGVVVGEGEAVAWVAVPPQPASSTAEANAIVDSFSAGAGRLGLMIAAPTLWTLTR